MMQPLCAPATHQGRPHCKTAEDSSSERGQQKVQKMPMLHGTGTADRIPQVYLRARQKKMWAQTQTSRRHHAPWKPATRSPMKSKGSFMLLPYIQLVLLGMAIGVAAVACTQLLMHIHEREPTAAVAAQPKERTAVRRPAPAEVETREDSGPAFSPEQEDLSGLRLTWSSYAPGEDEVVEHSLQALGDTRAVFHGRSSTGVGFTPPFDGNAREVFACVDAGNSDLWIGGGGINGEIAEQLLRAARHHHLNTSPSQMATVTAELHAEALKKAKQRRGTLVRLDSHEHPSISPFRTVFAYVPGAHPTWDEEATGQNVASVFIDVLHRQYKPYNNPLNAYVVYVVPPKGSAPDADFKPAYKETYASIVSAVNQFNQYVRRGQQIQRLRIPLLSGGIFASGRSPRDLGSQAMQALSSSMVGGDTRVKLDFAWEASGAFFRAARDLEQGRGRR